MSDNEIAGRILKADEPRAMPPELVLSIGDNVWVPSLSNERKAARVVSYDVNTACVGVEHETACGEQAWSLHWVRRSSVQRWDDIPAAPRCEVHGTYRNANGKCFLCDHPEDGPDAMKGTGNA